MYTEYENEISEDMLSYQEIERPSDIQFPPIVNTLLLAVWMAISLVGFAVMFIGKSYVVGTVIIAVPTFIGMIMKPTFALCVLMLVLPTGAGIGIEQVFSLDRGIGIALAISFALNVLISRPKLRIGNKALWVLIAYSFYLLVISFGAPFFAREIRRVFTQFQLLALVLIICWIIESNGERAFIWALRSYVVGTLGAIAITFMTGAAMRSMTDVSQQERYGATLGRTVDQNMLAAMVAMAFLAAVYLLIRDRNMFFRMIYLTAIVFLPIMLLKIGSRGAILALVLTLISPMLFLRQVVRRPAIIASSVIVVILVAGLAASALSRSRLEEGVTEHLTNIKKVREGIDYRLVLIKQATDVGFSKLTGASEYGWLNYEGRHYPHSDLFFALGLYGVPAALLVAVFLIMMMLTVKRTPFGIEKLYTRAVLTFLLIMGLDIVQLYLKYFWVFIAIIIAGQRIGWLKNGSDNHIPEYLSDETEVQY